VTANPADWIRDARQYLIEVRNEYRKVTWPTQKEYVGGTIGVLVVVGVMTLVLGVVDFTLNQVLRLVLP
jgi:preprotein translocase subunit SecE